MSHGVKQLVEDETLPFGKDGIGGHDKAFTGSGVCFDHRRENKVYQESYGSFPSSSF